MGQFFAFGCTVYPARRMSGLREKETIPLRDNFEMALAGFGGCGSRSGLFLLLLKYLVLSQLVCWV